MQQYRHYLQMLREVKEANPEMGLQGCNSGGEWCNWDKLELLENNQVSDGGGPDDLYYLSYFWPVAKLMEWGVGSDPMSWTTRPDELRQDILLRRYLRQRRRARTASCACIIRARRARRTRTPISNHQQRTHEGRDLPGPLPKGEVVVYPKRLVPGRLSRGFRFDKRRARRRAPN